MRKKLIIAGSRYLTIDNDRIYTWVDWAFRSFWDMYHWDYTDLEIVSGAARGVDASGERFAHHHKDIKLTTFPANWADGKGAGHARNKKMALYADGALIFFNKEPSPGSSNMAGWMAMLEKPFKVLLG